jgi:polysaccharide deacetylase 2 family uncharacterized protein YibQ
MAFLFWQGRSHNYSGLSARLNDSLSGLLAKSGVGSANVVDASSSEKKAGLTVWKEYYRKVQLPASADVRSLVGNLESQARQYHLRLDRTDGPDGRISVEICRGDKRLSHLVFVLAAKKKEQPLPVPVARKRFALVIDDIGGRRDLSPLIDLGIPLTFSIMPFERFSKDIARDLAGRHMPYMLHLPLEPLAYPKVDPGKAALLMRMSEAEMRKKFAADLASVPGAIGINNHMGSRFSEDEQKMRFLLGLVKEQGLFYLDSYTSVHTKASLAARSVPLPFKVNMMFVDLQDTPEFMSKQFEHILKTFGHRNEFVAIGHIQKKNLIPVLKEYIPKFKDAGIEFVYLSDLMSDATKH